MPESTEKIESESKARASSSSEALSYLVAGPDLDQETFHQLSLDAVHELKNFPRGTTVSLNLSRVDMMSSLCLGAVLCLQQQIDTLGGRFEISGCQPQVRDLLRITRLDAVIEVVDAVADEPTDPSAKNAAPMAA